MLSKFSLCDESKVVIGINDDQKKTFNDLTFNDLYDASEYYFKSPVFKNQIEDLKITITEPPSKDHKDKQNVSVYENCIACPCKTICRTEKKIKFHIFILY